MLRKNLKSMAALVENQAIKIDRLTADNASKNLEIDQLREENEELKHKQTHAETEIGKLTEAGDKMLSELLKLRQQAADTLQCKLDLGKAK